MTELVSSPSRMHLPSNNNMTRYDVEVYLHQNPIFAQNFVVQYLKTNQEFADRYFIENASKDLFQKRHEENMNLTLHRSQNTKLKSTTFNVSINEEEIANADVSTSENVHSIDLHGRRKSDPIKKDMRKRNGADALDTITEFSSTPELRKSYTFPKTKYRTISVDDNNNANYTESEDCEQSTQWIYNLDSNYNKPYLRKARSAPAYKANLSHLIQSSVYSGSPFNRQINVENRMLLKHLNEENLLVEIIKDVSKDLSLNRTCFRILVNFGFMLNIAKASIYIAYESEGTDFLRLQLQHVTIEDGVRRGSLIHKHAKQDCVPFGEGIVGQVALTGESFICNDIEKTGVYDSKHDKWYDETVKNVLLHPIKDAAGKTIAVIVGINCKTGEFTEEDKEIGSAFLSFCGVSITNAKIFEKTKEEFERNKDLLELSHDVFEEQTSLNKVIQKVLNRAIEMFKCKKCSLMLIDDPKETDERRLFSKLYQVTSSDRKDEYRFSKFQRDSMVFSSNFDPFIDGVADPKALNSRQNKKLILHSTPISSVQTGIYTDKDTICIPIRNNLTQIIGVLKLSERENNNPLSCNEESFLEAFSIFSGLGINNCIMYDNILKGQAHQKVSLEALSYHTAARQSDVDKLKMSVIPSCHAFNLTSLTFDDFSLLENEMLTASIRMFMEFGFLKKYQIEYEVLCRFLITVKNNYRRVIYHNWRHAFNVTQSMFAVLTAGKVSEQLSSSECLSLLVGCLCHDLDHRGTNNEFQLKTDSPLAKLYGTSTMEHHHFNRAVMILNSEGNNIFSHLQSEEYRKVMKLLKHAILATDLSNYIRQRETFSSAIKAKSFNTNKPENRAMLRSMLMTACDLSGITKPWNIQKRVVHLVTSEFFHQGDIEKHRLNVQPKQMMDRKYILQLPKLQVQFFEMMGIPVYEILAEFNENLTPLSEGAKRNKTKWLEMSAQIEQGHVNPDIEPVLQPVKNEDEIFYP